VITGSFNFTTAAEKNNAENLLVIDDAELAAKYTANWKNHGRHAVAYSG
jgi:phosphatidylserine/phosphatidylglycerophosphate/cardiolipin synthase-like enzyme